MKAAHDAAHRAGLGLGKRDDRDAKAKDQERGEHDGGDLNEGDLQLGQQVAEPEAGQLLLSAVLTEARGEVVKVYAVQLLVLVKAREHDRLFVFQFQSRMSGPFSSLCARTES